MSFLDSLLDPDSRLAPREVFEVPLTPDVVAANLGMHLDVPLSRNGYQPRMRGPAGLGWERQLGLSSKIAMVVLALLAVGIVGDGGISILLAVLCLSAAVVVWFVRRPSRYELAFTPLGASTRIEVVAGRHKTASDTIEAFARTHGGGALKFVAFPASPSTGPAT